MNTTFLRIDALSKTWLELKIPTIHFDHAIFLIPHLPYSFNISIFRTDKLFRIIN